MYRLIKIVNAARLHVALTYALIAITFVWTNGVSIKELVAVLCFTALLSATYLFNRVTDVDSDRISQPGEELEGNFILFFVVLLAFTPVVFLLAFSLPILPYLAFIVVGALYSVPVIAGRSFREILILKNIYAAGAWYISLILLKSVYATSAPFLDSIFSSIHVFALAFVFEVIWDIRDAEADRSAAIATIPNKFGMTVTRLLLVTVLVWVLWLLNFDMMHPLAVATAVLIPVSLFATPKTPRPIFHIAVYFMLVTVATLILW